MLIDASACSQASVIEWLVHSLFSLSDLHQDLARELLLQPIVAGEYSLTELATGVYSLDELPIRDFSRADIIKLCAIDDDEDRKPNAFQVDAIDEVIYWASGDKYFTNYLCREAYSFARRRNPFSPVAVRKQDVTAVAELLKSGRVLDTRILPKLDRLVREKPSLHSAIENLCSNGSMAWPTISRMAKQELFESGALQLDWDRRTANPAGSALLDVPLVYTLRNRMIREYLLNSIRGIRRIDSLEPLINLSTTEPLEAELRTLYANIHTIRGQYAGMYVAVRRGSIVDSDYNKSVLSLRIAGCFPAEEVLVVYIDSTSEIGELLTRGVGQYQLPKQQVYNIVRATLLVLIAATAFDYVGHFPSGTLALASIVLVGAGCSLLLAFFGSSRTKLHERVGFIVASFLMLFEVLCLVAMALGGWHK